MKLALARIAELISAGGGFDQAAAVEGYSIDSRTIAPGELFFAIVGERLDGHDYVRAALEKGAVGAVVSESRAAEFAAAGNILTVKETLPALQTLGAGVRRLWGKTLIGVTGSAGKTTTKEAIAAVLGSRFHTLKSEGNLNNHFGLPLQLLRLTTEHDVAVMEMGMSHAGEIMALAKLAQPNIGVVTLVAPVHLEFFKSVAEIARAKYELIESLPAGGVAVLNADDPYVSQFGRDFHGKVLTFGIEHAADVRAEDVNSLGGEGSRFRVDFENQAADVRLPLIGRHNVYNALAALAVGVDRGVTLDEGAGALAKLRPYDKRGQMLEIGRARVIDDCYNSNPKALISMVEALGQLKAQRHIVVAGEMLELGAEGERLHRESGEQIAARGADVLLGVRGLAREMVMAAKQAGIAAEFVSTPEEAGEWLARNVHSGDAVLLKASRGVKLEKALESWKNAAKSSVR